MDSLSVKPNTIFCPFAVFVVASLLQMECAVSGASGAATIVMFTLKGTCRQSSCLLVEQMPFSTGRVYRICSIHKRDFVRGSCAVIHHHYYSVHSYHLKKTANEREVREEARERKKEGRKLAKSLQQSSHVATAKRRQRRQRTQQRKSSVSQNGS